MKIKKYKKILQAIMVMIFWDFLMFYQIFLSTQVKRREIISNKYGICVLPHELPKELLPTALSSLGGLTCPHEKKKA